MKRKIIKIEEDKCNGCGLCAKACHEGAITMVNGEAKLIRDDYCDGLGDCLPVCPTGAISFEEREALAYDEEAVKTNQEKLKKQNTSCGCMGSKPLRIRNSDEADNEIKFERPFTLKNHLNQWPVQLKLVPANAQYFDGADLLIAADCSAYAYSNFHSDFMKNKITLIGCPKLDEGDYSEKLTAILHDNNIKSVTVVRMEVPCCGGLSNAVVTALRNCGKMIPWQIVTITTDGKVI